MKIKIKNLIIRNKNLIIITFEIFWIIIFILDKLSTENSLQIPEFIYVNF
jgi:hypothetical protein